MIEKVSVEYFKMFEKAEFDLSDPVVLAGPNNKGKTTLLQAIAAWNFAFRRWRSERGPQTRSTAKERTGIGISRQSFSVIPLRSMDLLWKDRSTAFRKSEGQKPGAPRPLRILVEGSTDGKHWSLGMQFYNPSSELMYTRPVDTPDDETVEIVQSMQVVHVPPFSGIEVEETRYDRDYQDYRIGQGRPGEILRNLLLEIHRDHPDKWNQLQEDIEEIFAYRLLDPDYAGKPFIVCEYQPVAVDKRKQRREPRLDIACAGSGFLQVLMMLGFFYARPASVLLFDEPDAHLHVVLQKQIHERLRDTARRNDCQLIIATHSEVLIESTTPEKILSFYQKPHILETETDRNQVREALKRLGSMELLAAEQWPGILYVEGESDFNLLREWARVLDHEAFSYLKEEPLWHSIRGSNPKEAKGHFFALRAVKPEIRGILLLDGDNRGRPDREVSTAGLAILKWKRYEAENYLVHPDALIRFVRGNQPDLFKDASASKGEDFLRSQLPPVVYQKPLSDHEFLESTPASKTLLPGFFKAAGLNVTKNEYYQIAAQMKPEEIPEEVVEKLDEIARLYEEVI
ncbi:MAG: AAA family ATPase [Actinobacteria bacterium]|nr:AAA family ATPase [Actinomycetota bacterium]MBU4392199.1 AAA family ATPase [Actinomycetota bacterium]MBU4403063.1 AAA family ATPase [Actinomycetota bacterium]MCG2818048.1 AAA family ATPase [Actinomycetes bacterium]